MRDAFGGTFMIKLLIVFIIIYVGFTAIALNYAKAFKAKNKVIEYLEKNELAPGSDGKITASEYNKLNQYIEQTILGKDMNYRGTIKCTGATEEIYCKYGIQVISKKAVDNNKEGDYYVVSTVFGWEIPYINVLLRANGEKAEEITFGQWKIKGETRTIINSK